MAIAKHSQKKNYQTTNLSSLSNSTSLFKPSSAPLKTDPKHRKPWLHKEHHSHSVFLAIKQSVIKMAISATGIIRRSSKALLSRKITLLVLGVVLFFQFSTNSVHLLAHHFAFFPLQHLLVQGDISTSTKRQIQQNQQLTQLVEKSISLISIDTQKLQETLMRNDLLKEVTVTKKYPNTLVVDVKEREDLLVLLHNSQTRIFLLSGEELQPSSSFTYNHFFLEVEDAQMAEALKNQLILLLNQIPEKEKDFLRYFSNLRYSEGHFFLFPADKKGGLQRIVWAGELTPEKIRQARYSYLYFLQKLQNQGWRTINITAELTRFSKN